MTPGLLVLSILLALPAPCSPTKGKKNEAAVKKGDSVILLLQGGREVAGIYVERKDGAIWVSVDQGEIGIDTTTIVEMRVEASDTSEFRKRRSVLKDTDVEGHFALAQWAREKGLESSAVAEAEHVLVLDPSHRLAHFFLGHVGINGKWLTRTEAAPLTLDLRRRRDRR